MSEPVRPTQREYWNSQVGEEWVRQADRTDRMFQGLTAAAFKALALQPGERVLDIGCGAGDTTLAAARQVGPNGGAVGADISRPLLQLGAERAKASGLSIDFVEADAGAAQLPGAPFDAAFSRFGVMFFEDPVAAFAHIRASLRSGGRLVFICWRSFDENAWTSAPLDALKPMLTAPLPPPDQSIPGPLALADPSKIKAILNASGWRELAIDPWDGPLIVGADPKDAAAYLLKIGPSARAIAEHKLDAVAAEQLIMERLAEAQTSAGVSLSAACWIVRAFA
jgi:SAM-dependent methyltransferase